MTGSALRVIVVGLGVQGRKRLAIAGRDVVATVDPVQTNADYRAVDQVPLASYDGALVCTPDDTKTELLTYLLDHAKHVLAEKPLGGASDSAIEALGVLARARDVTCYTAYNHRFEPHVARMKALLDSGELGRLYRCRLFYGNGTARDVRESPWRDKGAGVLPDLGSHLLDMVLFWFGHRDREFQVTACHRFENAAPDHIVISAGGEPALELEMTLVSWRNRFTCDLFAERGSAHIDSLCKWGPSTFVHRRRKLPSGVPDEEIVTLVQPDPTWRLEYEHFRRLCSRGETDLTGDGWINRRLTALTARALEA